MEMLFFFSSRRRHTRLQGDWSSDVCSSDLSVSQSSDTFRTWLFWGFFFAFAIKVPMFPFHTWLPDAHTEAPTAGSRILARVLFEMGTDGFIPFSLPLLPPDASVRAKHLPIVNPLSLIGII